MTTILYRAAKSGAALIYAEALPTGAPVGDTTAPTLTAAGVSNIGSNSATGAVTTNESGGTLYWLASTSAVVTAAAVKAGASKAVVTAGAQTVSVTSLTASTLYYLHFLHADAATPPNESAVVRTASFTTANAPDLAGPIMDGSLLYTKTATTTTITVPAQTDPSGIGEYFFAIDGGAFVSNGTNRTKAYTGLTPLTPHLYEVKANDGVGNPSGNSLSITVVTDAAGEDPSLVTKSIVVTLKGRDLSVRANASGINWEWSDARGVVTSSGTGLVGSASGVLTIPIRTRLLSDATGRLSLDNYNGGNILTYQATQLWVRVP